MYSQRQRGLRGEERLLAERLATAVEPVAGYKPLLPGGPPECTCSPREAAAWAAEAVLEDRRSPAPGRGLGRLIAWAAASAPAGVVGEALAQPIAAIVAEEVKGGAPGLRGLMSAAARYASKPTLQTLASLVAVAAREASRPCRVDPTVERERERLEARMKALGLVLGATLPVLFILSLYVHPAAGLAAVALAAAVWGAVLSVGRRFRAAVIEEAWAACKLTGEELRDIVYGRDLPPLYDLLGGGASSTGISGTRPRRGHQRSS